MWKYNHTDELYHYGVLGMKWGKRRYQNKDGTLTADGRAKYGNDISQRKTKHVKKQVQTGIKTKTINYDDINKKVYTELGKTKEAKAVKNVNNLIESMYKQAESQGISRSQVMFSKTDADWINQINADYNNKTIQIAKKYSDAYASRTLKTLGYADTKNAREWLKKQNFMDW